MVPHEPPTALSILDRAVNSGMTPESLEKLVALAERMADRQAAQEFNTAMAAFKAACPPVVRRAENGQFKVTRNGVQQNRRYASMEDIEATIRKPLGDAGLSYRWSSATFDKGQMTLSCVVSHIGGHSVESAVSLPTASSAGCSEIQKIGAAMTYAQRYSLVQALGLTSCDEDNDGNEDPTNTISEKQAMDLDAEIDELHVDRHRLLAFAGVDRLADIPAAMWPKIREKMDAKRASLKNGGAR
jgi:hypothetical protein